MRTASSIALGLLLTACGAKPDANAASSSAASALPRSATSAPSGSAVGAAALDPQMAALSKDILACPFDATERSFKDCKALELFRKSADAYFKSDAGDEALFTMLTGSDEKLAVIAAQRAPNGGAGLDKAHVERLFDLVESGKAPNQVQRAAPHWLAYADLAKLGLVDRSMALAKNANVDVRKAVADGILDRRKGPPHAAAYDLEEKFLDDANADVVRNAALSLAGDALDAPGDAGRSCDLLAKAIDKADENSGAVVFASAKTEAHCKGLGEKVVDYIESKTHDPKKIAPAFGRSDLFAASVDCSRPRARGGRGSHPARRSHPKRRPRSSPSTHRNGLARRTARGLSFSRARLPSTFSNALRAKGG